MVIRQDEIDIENIEESADIYSFVMPGTKLELVTETKRWVEIVKNAGQTEVPSSIVESLKLCHNLRTYPNIEALLKILAIHLMSLLVLLNAVSMLSNISNPT